MKGLEIMGKYSVPDNIRKFKPKGTMVKVLHDKYYVYEYSCVKDESDGKWKTKMGKLIGSIQEGIGFIPNSSYNRNMDMTTLEYGQYALAYKNSSHTLELLLDVFNAYDAYQIYFMSIMYFVNGFIPLKNIDKYFKQSYFLIIYPDLKLSQHVLSILLNSLGQQQENVHKFEQTLINKSSGEIAIDGHVIRSCSHDNDLAQKGNKYNLLKEKQFNVLMAYDINTNKPLLSRVYEGSVLDKLSIQDYFNRFEFKDILFIVDRGFYSKGNIELFSKNGNSYIIPLAPDLLNYKEVTKDMRLKKVFVYEKKRSTIEYSEYIYDKNKIIVYRDVNKSALDQADYLVNMEKQPEKYTVEGYNKVKDFFGVIVLQTNLVNKSAKEIYELYKKRWKIETFFNYFKNNIEFSSIHLSDYYMNEGLSFIMLIVGLIHNEVNESFKKAKLSGYTIDDILLEGRFIKTHWNRGHWSVENIKKSRQDIMNSMNVDFKELDGI